MSEFVEWTETPTIWTDIQRDHEHSAEESARDAEVEAHDRLVEHGWNSRLSTTTHPLPFEKVDPEPVEWVP